jgi:hypothetical protein
MDADANETRLLFLGSSRRDTNSARLGILTELDAALKDLGRAIRKVLSHSVLDTHRLTFR